MLRHLGIAGLSTFNYFQLRDAQAKLPDTAVVGSVSVKVLCSLRLSTNDINTTQTPSATNMHSAQRKSKSHIGTISDLLILNIPDI